MSSAKQQTKSSKYMMNDSDENQEEQVQQTKPTSKYAVAQSDSEEEKKPKQVAVKSKFQVEQSSDEEPDKSGKTQSSKVEEQSKPQQQTKGGSRFQVQQSDDDSDGQIQQQDQKKGNDDPEKKSKGQKKKEKDKKKNEIAQQQGEDHKDEKKDNKKEDKKGAPAKNNITAKLALELQKKRQQEEDRLKKEREEEERKEQEEEERRREAERLKKEEEERIKREKEEQIRIQKSQGLHLTKKQREQQEKLDRLKQQQIENLIKTGQFELVRQLGVQVDPEVIKQYNLKQSQQSQEPQQQQQEPQIQPQTEQPQSQQPQAQKPGKKKFEDPEVYRRRIEQEKKLQEQKELEKKLSEKQPTNEQKEDEEGWEDEIKDLNHTEQTPNNSSTKKKKKSSVIEEDIFPKHQKGENVLRSPIICILGHVDTGKTTLLDKLRNTSVQENEAGGITQQIGATFFPGSKISSEIAKCNSFYPTELKAPGILVIDTPGHESFSNLRSRGSGLCDFAILVVDLMHGLEKQTIESLQLLRDRKTPFVIALNKIDRCAEWKPKKFGSSYQSLGSQSQFTRDDFDKRYKEIITQLNEQSFNVELYWKNDNIRTHVPIVPTSGITGEGIPDILAVIVKYTQQLMSKKFVAKDEFNCTVMEVKMIEGHGTTIDCILIDGILKKGDHIVLLGFNGPIKTKIRAVLTPHPMKEMRVKGEYINHEQIYAAMGVKLAAPGLEDAVAGSALYVVNSPEEEQQAFEDVSSQLEEVKQKVKLSQHGVGVAASTLGSLEALCMFLNQENIPVSYVTVGPVSKDDVQKAMKSLLADEVENRRKEFAVMLVFDVKVRPEAQKYADENGVKIFTAQIIYHLCKSYFDYYKQVQEERLVEKRKKAVFPCQLKIVKIFNQKLPIILGVEVEKGSLRPGCPICVYDGQENPKIGFVESIQKDKKDIAKADSKSGQVAIRIKDSGNIQAGRQFTEEHKLISQITRDSIDCLKEFFKDQVTQEEWIFIRDHLKKIFKIH